MTTSFDSPTRNVLWTLYVGAHQNLHVSTKLPVTPLDTRLTFQSTYSNHHSSKPSPNYVQYKKIQITGVDSPVSFIMRHNLSTLYLIALTMIHNIVRFPNSWCTFLIFTSVLRPLDPSSTQNSADSGPFRIHYFIFPAKMNNILRHLEVSDF